MIVTLLDARSIEFNCVDKQRYFSYVCVVVLLKVVQDVLHNVGVVRLLIVLEQTLLLATNVLGEIGAC